MKDMAEKEIRALIEEWTWGTLIAVEGDKPYAIENTYASDGKYIYCGSMPRGRMARCIKKNPNVVYKICNAEKDYKEWKAVIVEGKAERLTKKEDMLYAMRLIAKKRGLPENHYDSIGNQGHFPYFIEREVTWDTSPILLKESCHSFPPDFPSRLTDHKNCKGQNSEVRSQNADHRLQTIDLRLNSAWRLMSSKMQGTTFPIPAICRV